MHKLRILLGLFAGAALLSLPAYGGLFQDTDDAKVAEEIRAQFARQSTLAMLNIEVDVHEGVVSLAGTVGSPQDAKLAMNLASAVPGVRDVRSTLRPLGGASPAPDREARWSDFGQRVNDMTLQADVRTRLLSSNEIDGVGIGVRIKDGVALLEGNVESEEVRQEAERIVMEVRGIREVDNLLIVER